VNADIVGSKKRETVNIADWIYIYIPMTAQEKKQFAPDVCDPCWRIAVREPKPKIEISILDAQSFEDYVNKNGKVIQDVISKCLRNNGIRATIKQYL
jgi:hypothetical protein